MKVDEPWPVLTCANHIMVQDISGLVSPCFPYFKILILGIVVPGCARYLRYLMAMSDSHHFMIALVPDSGIFWMEDTHTPCFFLFFFGRYDILYITLHNVTMKLDVALDVELLSCWMRCSAKAAHNAGLCCTSRPDETFSRPRRNLTLWHTWHLNALDFLWDLVLWSVWSVSLHPLAVGYHGEKVRKGWKVV